MPLKAPFPYFGGKSSIASMVWKRIGDVSNYVEPFCGSIAMLLSRPHKARIETINDFDCYVANFWRATSADPELVAIYADNPVNEADLHARHRWLVLSDDAAEFRHAIRNDPLYYDARSAGWWAWGLCCWIGSGWCDASRFERDKNTRPSLLKSRGVQGELWSGRGNGTRQRGLNGQLPDLSGDYGAAGRGVNASAMSAGKDPALWDQEPQLANWNGQQGVTGEPHEKRPQLHIGNSKYGAGVHKMPRLVEKKPLTCGSGHSAGVAGAGPQDIDQKRPRAHRENGSQTDGYLPGVNGRPQLADAYDIGRGVNSHGELGTCEQRRAWLINWFSELRDRIRNVRVCCGDWERVCSSPSVTTRLGTTGIFKDPPYALDIERMHAWIRFLRGEGPEPAASSASNRSNYLYATDQSSDTDRLVARVHIYCAERGADPKMRIALCGYAGEHDALEQFGWDVVEWRSQGGYGNRSGNSNRDRERIWFSPACKAVKEKQALLFGKEID